MSRAGRRARVLVASLLLAGAAAGGDLRGTETGLPIDEDLVGCWLRERAGGVRAEAACYRRTGRYVRITRQEGLEEGVWVTFTRGRLRWLRRCAAEGSRPVSPDDCLYFGRYLQGSDELIEEEACPDAWVGMLTSEPSFDLVRKSCQAVGTRLDDDVPDGELQGVFAELVEGAGQDEPATASDLRPKEPSGGEGSMSGTWVGTVGAGPGRVTLTFYARQDGSFEYVLEAAGQSDSAGGKWGVDEENRKDDEGTFLLHHEDGEVEKIPFRLEGDKLFWTDEDLGELELTRDGA